MIETATVNPAVAGPAPRVRRAVRLARLARFFVLVVLVAFGATLLVDLRIALTLLILGAFMAAVIGLRTPVAGLLGLGLLCTLDAMATPLLLTGGLWRWNTLNYWLLAVTVLFSPLLLRHRDARVGALVALLCWLAIGLAWSPDVAGGVQHILGAVAMFGMLVYFLRANRFRGAWYWLAVVNGVTGLAASLAFLRQQSALPYLNENIWSHAPVVGVLSVVLAFAASSLSRGRQLLLAGLAAADAGMVFLSGSRGNLAIVLVALFAIALMTPSLGQNLTVLVASLLLGIGVISQFPALEERTVGRLEIMLNPHESARRRTSGRFDLALGGWYIFQAHPMGAGTGSFPQRWSELGVRRGISSFKRGVPMSAHAGWVKTLAENGIPGILLLVTFVSSFAIAGWRARGWHARVLGFTVSAVIAVGLLSTEFQSKSLWFLAAGATVLLATARPDQRRPRPRKVRRRTRSRHGDAA
jgi:hypothetical protein